MFYFQILPENFQRGKVGGGADETRLRCFEQDVSTGSDAVQGWGLSKGWLAWVLSQEGRRSVSIFSPHSQQSFYFRALLEPHHPGGLIRGGGGCSYRRFTNPLCSVSPHDCNFFGGEKASKC